MDASSMALRSALKVAMLETPQQQPAPQQQPTGQDAGGAPSERALGELRAEIAEGWSYRMVLQLCDVADPTVRLGAILAGDEVYSPRIIAEIALTGMC